MVAFYPYHLLSPVCAPDPYVTPTVARTCHPYSAQRPPSPEIASVRPIAMGEIVCIFHYEVGGWDRVPGRRVAPPVCCVSRCSGGVMELAWENAEVRVSRPFGFGAMLDVEAPLFVPFWVVTGRFNPATTCCGSSWRFSCCGSSRLGARAPAREWRLDCTVDKRPAPLRGCRLIVLCCLTGLGCSQRSDPRKDPKHLERSVM